MKLGITMLIHNKDDIKFVTEFPCFLGHPVVERNEEMHENHAVLFLYIFKQFVQRKHLPTNIIIIKLLDIRNY